MVFSQFLESSTGRSVIGMSLLFAWVYVSDYFEVIPLLAMTIQVLVRFASTSPLRTKDIL